MRPVCFCALAIALFFGLGHSLLSNEKPVKRGVVKLTEEGLKIHREGLLIDGHNDLPWQFRRKDDFSFRSFDIARPQPLLHTDIERLKKGGVGAQF